MILDALLLALQTPAAQAQPARAPAEARVFAVPGTDVQVRAALPGLIDVPERLAGLRKAQGEMLLYACDLGSPDVRVMLRGGPAATLPAEEWRRLGLGERNAGAGLFVVGRAACSELIRSLNPPYRDVDRQAFVVVAGAMVNLQVVALEHTDPEALGRGGFGALVEGLRYAVVRRGSWEDRPQRWLDLSHEACLRADGVAWLAEQAAAEKAGWIEHLALAEHATALRDATVDVAAHAEAARVHLAALEKPGRPERSALMLAQDLQGLALAHEGDGKQDDAHQREALAHAEEHLRDALSIAKELGGVAEAGITADLALLRAAAHDAEGCAELLDAAFAQDPGLKARLVHDPLLDPVRNDERVAPLLKLPKPPPAGRQLGR
jgi:hypothetical protein